MVTKFSMKLRTTVWYQSSPQNCGQHCGIKDLHKTTNHGAWSEWNYVELVLSEQYHAKNEWNEIFKANSEMLLDAANSCKNSQWHTWILQRFQGWQRFRVQHTLFQIPHSINFVSNVTHLDVKSQLGLAITKESKCKWLNSYVVINTSKDGR